MVSGDYNDDDLIFEVRMAHDGDMVFDASGSDFEIASLEAFNVEAMDEDGDGILTMINLEHGMDIYIQLSADEGTYGTWSVQIICTSDSPTKTPTDSPSIEPTVSPSVLPTVDPSADPTKGPSASPTASPSAEPTMEPTTDPTEPTVSPSEPTKLPTTGPTEEPTVNPTASPSTEPTVEPTNSPICHGAVYQGSMTCDGDECDALWGGESLVSSNCEYLLTMEESGNLVLYEGLLKRGRVHFVFLV